MENRSDQLKTLYGYAGAALAIMGIYIFLLIAVATFDLPEKWMQYGCGYMAMAALILFGWGCARHALGKIPLW
jgi:hypothetical protein